jgi:TatA/E family protein of Tat protein translocase
MFGFGHGPELIIILVIALIVLGPGKIPEIAQMLGKGLRELRQASSELQRTFDVNELMNPTPPAPAAPEPPPVEAAPAPLALTQTIAPPDLVAAARPKRTRKGAVPSKTEATEAGAVGTEPSLAEVSKPKRRRAVSRVASDRAASAERTPKNGASAESTVTDSSQDSAAPWISASAPESMSTSAAPGDSTGLAAGAQEPSESLAAVSAVASEPKAAGAAHLDGALVSEPAHGSSLAAASAAPRRRARTNSAAAVNDGEAKPRRRASRETSETVSLDAPA